ncbi:hypothetical protein BDB01DRAFT_499129 [Pilobolus umbonatus]|nr:hypothetical protein BDB01DRAFT_499129 [Pilobolus umbonatus]
MPILICLCPAFKKYKLISHSVHPPPSLSLSLSHTSTFILFILYINNKTMPYTYNQNDIIDLDNENSFHSHNNTYNPFRINLHSVDDEEVEQIKRELVTPQPRNTHSPLTRNYYHYHDKNTHNRTSINSYDQFNSMDNTNESVLLFKNMINGDDSVSVDFVQSDLKDFVGSYPLDDLLSRPASRMPSNNSPVFQHNNDTMERNYHHPSRSTTTSPLNQLGRETLSMENNNDSHGNYNGYYPYGYTQPVQDTRREQGDVSTLLNSNTNRLSGRYSSDTLSPRITPFEPYESKLLSPSFKPFKTASTSQLHHEEKRNQLLSAVERSYRTEAMCNASLSDTTRNYDHRISLIDSNKNKRQSVDSVNLMKLRQDSDDLLERRNSLLKARAHRRLSIIEPINELKELRQLKELKEPAGNSQAINSNTSTDKLSSLYSDHSAESEDLFADNSYHKHRLSPDYISNRNISPTFNRSRAFSLGSSDSSNISYHMDKLDITRTKNEREIPVERVTSPVGRYRKQTSSFNLNYKQAGRVFPEHPAIEEESPNNKHSKLIELANENEIIPQPHASYKHSNTNIPISASQSTGGLSNSTTSSSHSEDIYYDPPTHSSHKILRHHPIDRITSPTSMRQIETQIEKAESRYADYLDRIKRGNNTVLKQRIEAEQDTSAVYRRRRVISEDSQLYKSQVDQDTERSRVCNSLLSYSTHVIYSHPPPHIFNIIFRLILDSMAKRQNPV